MAHRTPGNKVVGIGVACLDQLILWEDMAAPVREATIATCDMQGGGMAATAMVTVTRLGGEAEVWAAVGNDWVGDRILKGLDAERVDTSQVRRIDDATSPFMVVCIDRRTAERHFLHWTGLCDADSPLGSLERLQGAGCLLTDLTRPETDLAAAREARRLGVPVVADAEGMGERAREVFTHVDHAIADEGCLRDLGAGADHRQACEAIRAMGPAQVVITLGERGLVFLDGERFGRMDAFDIEAVDTTGAGDVFHGAFCYGLTRGLAMDANLAFASAAAALKCRRLGGRAGIPRRDDVVRFLKDQGVDLSV